jgi:hypothetical protein
MVFNVSGGGGVALNFKVLAYATESAMNAATPTENTIGIITTTPITSYVFSITQPTGSAGMVWITTGTTSINEFNALKKNSIQVYPQAAKQYVSGAWVDKTAKSYMGGVWEEWLPKNYLFKAGYGALVEFTVGNETCAILPTITKDSITFIGNGWNDQNFAWCVTKKSIDFTNIKTLYVEATMAPGEELRFGTHNDGDSDGSSAIDGYTVMNTANTKKVYAFNTEGIVGNRWVKVTGGGGGAITGIWYE